MSRMRMIFLTLMGLLFLAGANAWTQSADDKLECVPEQPSAMYPQSQVVGAKDVYTVPRKQVLLELFERPT